MITHTKTYHTVVSITNNNTASNQHQYMAPVPSVCVRVPHSPSLDSGPCTPMKKLPIDSDITALAVRECATRVCMQKKNVALQKAPQNT